MEGANACSDVSGSAAANNVHTFEKTTTVSLTTLHLKQNVNIDAVKVATDSLNMENISTHRFAVWYLGSSPMHRLYTHTIQPWVMAEIKRRRDGIREVIGL